MQVSEAEMAALYNAVLIAVSDGNAMAAYIYARMAARVAANTAF